MPADRWSPLQYERFKRERSQPFYDLLAMVRAQDGMRIVDLGCGTGELTRVLHERLRAGETLGIDSSPAMLARCAEQHAAGLRFEQGDISAVAASWSATPPDPRPDLVFSNAALHWVDDHETLLTRLTRALAPGGQLAVQVPANDDQPAHQVARELAQLAPFRSALGGYGGMRPTLAPEHYARLLHRLGFAEQHVRLQVYAHLLPGRDDVVEWVKGTTLTAYEERLPAPLFAEFLSRYREALLPRLEDTRPHFYPFKRLLFWGVAARG